MKVTDLRVAVAEDGEAILEGVSFELHPGKIFALVGESGSGKSVTSLAAMRLLPEALAITGGAVSVGEEDLFDRTPCRLSIRCRLPVSRWRRPCACTPP
jgi:peptide/nickel transport system ATP-binding protein